jgi:hypothetical protein
MRWLLYAALVVALMAAWLRYGERTRRAILVITCLITLVAGAACAERWHTEFVRVYNNRYGTAVFSWLNDRFPGGTRICLMAYHQYPFIGAKRQFVINRPFRPGGPADVERYVRLNKDALIVTTTMKEFRHDRYSTGAEALENSCIPAKCVFRDKAFSVYQVLDANY